MRPDAMLDAASVPPLYDTGIARRPKTAPFAGERNTGRLGAMLSTLTPVDIATVVVLPAKSVATTSRP